MATLKLNKKYSGYYTNRAGDIKVTVLKYSQGWSGIIERFTHTAKDLENNTVEMFEAISDEMFAPTKKEVCETLTNWIIKNL